MATPNIVPRADSEGGLGTASKYWASAYIDTVYVGAGKVGRDADNNLDFSTDNNIFFKINGGNEIVMDANRIYPAVNGGSILGHPSYQWADLFLHDGAVINFNNGEITLTQADNKLILGDSDQFGIGNDGDLLMYHDTLDSYITNATGDLYIQNTRDDKDVIFRCDDGSGGTTAYLTLEGANVRTKIHKDLNIEDNVQLQIGNSQDLKLYHSGTHSFIESIGVGNLYITQYVDDADIILSSDDGSGGTTPYLTLDGSVVQTEFHKNTRHGDNVTASFGTSDDLQIVHNGTDSQVTNINGNLQFTNTADDKDISFASDNGAGGDAIYFYLDGSSAAHDGSATTALYTNWPDNSKITLGTSHDLDIHHGGTNSFIQNQTGDLYIINRADDKDILFQSDDGSGGVETYFFLNGGLSSPFTVFPDTSHLGFGNSLDLLIHHDTANSYITANGTGDLIISQETDDKDIIFKSDDGSGGTTEYLRLDGGSQEIKFYKAISNQANVNLVMGGGQIKLNDSGFIYLGESNDLQIYHNSSNSYISDQGTGNLNILATHLQLQNAAANKFYATFVDGGAASIFHNGTLTLATTATGIAVTGGATFSSDLDIGGGGAANVRLTTRGATDDSSAYAFEAANSSGASMFFIRNDAAVSVIGTLTVGANDTGHDVFFYGDTANRYLKWDASEDALFFPDNAQIRLGTSSDLRIYHDGTHSYIIENGTGNLWIGSNGGAIYLGDEGASEIYLQANDNGSVNLYHDNSKKFETTAAGVAVTGSLTPSLGITQPVASAAANVAAAVAGSIYNFSDADGAVVTLPDSGNGSQVGKTFEFAVTTTATSSYHGVICADTTNEKIIGHLNMIDTDTSDTQVSFAAQAGDSFSAVSMNGTTTGIAGSRFRLTNISADLWLIEGTVLHTGSVATPFAAE